jgi:hypothetical protein
MTNIGIMDMVLTKEGAVDTCREHQPPVGKNTVGVVTGIHHFDSSDIELSMALADGYAIRVNQKFVTKCQKDFCEGCLARFVCFADFDISYAIRREFARRKVQEDLICNRCGRKLGDVAWQNVYGDVPFNMCDSCHERRRLFNES